MMGILNAFRLRMVTIIDTSKGSGTNVVQEGQVYVLNGKVQRRTHLEYSVPENLRAKVP